MVQLKHLLLKSQSSSLWRSAEEVVEAEDAVEEEVVVAVVLEEAVLEVAALVLQEVVGAVEDRLGG